MQNIKQEAMNVISNMPENCSIEEIMYRLYVIDKINKGRDDVKNKKTISSDRLMDEVQSW